MVSKSIYPFLILSLTASTISAQVNVPFSCETVEKTDSEMEMLPWFGNNAYLEQIRDSANLLFSGGNTAQEREGYGCPDIEGAWLIPIRFWIYRESDIDPGMPTDRDLQIMMDRLNFLYKNNGLNVRFFMICPQYQTDFDLANANDWDVFWATFFGGNSDANAINVHITKLYNGGNGGVYNSFSDIIVVSRSVYTSLPGVSTLAHEIGHYFGLEHTHRGSDSGKCGQECVSRTRNFPSDCLSTGKMCEKNGDGLCDTPADPNLFDKVNASCVYTAGEFDKFGDAFVPDETNIMSYSTRACRNYFSLGQLYVMAYSILYIRTIFQIVDINETDPDKYEPDDSDVPGVPRPIVLGETQCHSFYDMIECQDPADWLIIKQGVLGSYQIRINNVDDAPNPVETVRVWNIGSNLMRSTEVATTIYTFGAMRIFEFPCSAFNTSNLLVEVVRKPDLTEGKYSIALGSTLPLNISGSEIICTGASYTVDGNLGGTTINWTSSPNITLLNTSSSTVTLQGFTEDTPPYWIEATVSRGDCSQTIRKTLSDLGVPNFFIVTETPACFSGGGNYSISNSFEDINYSWSCQGTPCGNIFPFGNGESAEVIPDGTEPMILVVTASDVCGNTLTKTKSIQVKTCKDRIENIIVTPNPTSSGIVNITIIDTYLTEGAYQVIVTNLMSETKYQAEWYTKEFIINLSELPNGIYYIEIYREETSASAPFIINK